MALMEQGGHGSSVAAPMVRRVMEAVLRHEARAPIRRGAGDRVSVLHRAAERPTCPGSAWAATCATSTGSCCWPPSGLVAFGMAMIYSATHADPDCRRPRFYVRSQAVGLRAGHGAARRREPRRLLAVRPLAAGIYGAIVAPAGGHSARRLGAHGRPAAGSPCRSCDLQTSELAKVLLIVVLLRVVPGRRGRAAATASGSCVLAVGYVAGAGRARLPPARPGDRPGLRRHPAWRCSWCGASGGATWRC